MGLMKKYFGNTRKPEGFMGRMMITGMNFGHKAVTSWGLSHISSLKPRTIAELGCGGGKTVERLLKMFPDAKVAALDYSEVSVEKTGKRNKKAVAAGRCQVVQGDVSRLPFDSNAYELATAFETIYFWPGPLESFQEVYRILKPQGLFMIVNEADGEEDGSEKWVNLIDGMRVYTKEELSGLLRQAGFREVRSIRDEANHRLCMLAKK